jgi:hypothetical protein
VAGETAIVFAMFGIAPNLASTSSNSSRTLPLLVVGSTGSILAMA